MQKNIKKCKKWGCLPLFCTKIKLSSQFLAFNKFATLYTIYSVYTHRYLKKVKKKFSHCVRLTQYGYSILSNKQKKQRLNNETKKIKLNNNT